MRARPWIIPAPYLLGITVAAVAFGLLAEATEFYPLSYPMPDESRFNQRLGESTALWVVLCCAASWIPVWRKRPQPGSSRYWPIVLVPVAIGAYVFASESQFTVPSTVGSPLGGSFFLWFFPVILGLMGSIMLWVQLWNVRRLGRFGACHNCGYDLRGTSGARCPECGLQVDPDGTARCPVSVRSLPEILLFDTASDRDAALRRTAKEEKLRHLLPYFAGLVCFGIAGIDDTAGWVWAWLAAGALIVFPATRLEVRRHRRRLRDQLRERGIRVCLHCGQDMRETAEDICPACRLPHAGMRTEVTSKQQ